MKSWWQGRPNGAARNVILSVSRAGIPAVVFHTSCLAASETALETATGAALSAQLLHDRDCLLANVVSWREVTIGINKAIDGRIICRDGRQFDVARTAPHLRFQFRLCQPSYC